jgi:hypothetical protein
MSCAIRFGGGRRRRGEFSGDIEAQVTIGNIFAKQESDGSIELAANPMRRTAAHQLKSKLSDLEKKEAKREAELAALREKQDDLEKMGKDLIDANRTLKKENAKVKADKAAARTERGQKDKRQFLGSKGQKTVVAKWIKQYDPASKHYYYENRESGESQWTQPEDYA